MHSQMTDFHPTLNELSTVAIRASISELEAQDRLTIALRQALKEGADINELSEITGLSCIEIRRRMGGNLYVLSEDALLAVG